MSDDKDLIDALCVVAALGGKHRADLSRRQMRALAEARELVAFRAHIIEQETPDD